MAKNVLVKKDSFFLFLLDFGFGGGGYLLALSSNHGHILVTFNCELLTIFYVGDFVSRSIRRVWLVQGHMMHRSASQREEGWHRQAALEALCHVSKHALFSGH